MTLDDINMIEIKDEIIRCVSRRPESRVNYMYVEKKRTGSETKSGDNIELACRYKSSSAVPRRSGRSRLPTAYARMASDPLHTSAISCALARISHRLATAFFARRPFQDTSTPCLVGLVLVTKQRAAGILKLRRAHALYDALAVGRRRTNNRND
ncbi:hypothetical protein EVAR_28527_1 [Eumeta japonica]|uniref:Uncharacterized protein n=1 Tax=Eumeta variegata TaxID=151549 RepID=A0A4C1WSU7_EUMVA|nr:hypothetical protein EVAR_28527_1 [Eumeta japonica]